MQCEILKFLDGDDSSVAFINDRRNRDDRKINGEPANEAFVLTESGFCLQFLSLSLSLSLSLASFPIVQRVAESRSHRVFRAPKGTSSHGWMRKDRPIRP